LAVLIVASQASTIRPPPSIAAAKSASASPSAERD
jgi:hypothetical protein